MRKNIIMILLSVAFSVLLWISISLSNEYNSTLHIPVRIINVPDGFTPTSSSSSELSLKVRGKGWNLLTAELTAQSEYLIDAGNHLDRKQIKNLKNFAAENAWLSSKLQILEIIPDSLSFTIEKNISIKKKVVPNLRLEFKDGYGLANVAQVWPESCIVSGPISLVNSFQEISTDIFVMNDLSERTQEFVPIKQIAGLQFEHQSVLLSLNIQRIVEQKFDEVLVEVLDIPGDRNVVLLPNRISVQLRGGIDVLGKLDKSKIKASVYYRDVVLDTTGSVVPNLDIPENTQLVNIQPEHLKFIIKKFNK